MAETWPATLPSPSPDGYGERPGAGPLRTEMEVGPPKVRRRTTTVVRQFDINLELTKAQIATLDTFYVTTLAGGVTEFDWTNPRTEAAATCRFVTVPVYTTTGGDGWQARFRMEVLP